ncbi:hypothetical protein C8P63_11284 [Melghirimyces profundicolus]|uniref:Sporulation related protein n=1 Tax=Melghirimyces profundicolus TaxID=1242148 RepID=A0A2T6BTH2_9BACL|nr:hypothetical protein [Melghirimyces profundicolus]PTX59388.1 hypothetical protein C8P63_11284 [Melghirimyces profundicolus]
MEKLRINVRTKNETIPLSSPEPKRPLPSADAGKEKGFPHGNPPGDPGIRRPLFAWWVREESDEELIGWGSPYSGRKRGRKKEGRIRSVITAVAGAVLLGGLMGLVTMTLFFSDDADFSNRTIDSHLREMPSDVEKSGIGKEGQEKSEEKAGEEKGYRLPELTAVLIQGGTFEKRSGALETVRKKRSEGRAAVSTEESPFRIYRGIAMEEKEARTVAALLKEKGEEIQLKKVAIADKPLSLSGVSREKSRQDISGLIKKGHHVFRLMGEKSAEGLRNQGSVSLEPVWQEVFQNYSDVAQTAPELEKVIPHRAKPHLVQMVRGLDQVVQNSRGYQKEPGTATFWQIQEGLVRYALAYEKFVDALR